MDVKQLFGNVQLYLEPAEKATVAQLRTNSARKDLRNVLQ